MERKLAFIYKITNMINGKIYIGKSSYDSLSKLIIRYKKEIKYPRESDRLIIRAIKKYGFSSFCFEVLQNNISLEQINAIEIDYISKLNSNNKLIGYNVTIGGEGTNGFKWNGESRKKLSKKMSDGRYAGCKNPFYNKHHNNNTKSKIIESNKRRRGLKGKPLSQKTKDKISKSKLGSIPWNKGIPYLQIMGSKNPNYKEINISKFIKQVKSGVHYSLICKEFNISYSYYYRKVKKLKLNCLL